jgi:hypothetical protein
MTDACSCCEPPMPGKMFTLVLKPISAESREGGQFTSLGAAATAGYKHLRDGSAGDFIVLHNSGETALKEHHVRIETCRNCNLQFEFGANEEADKQCQQCWDFISPDCYRLMLKIDSSTYDDESPVNHGLYGTLRSAVDTGEKEYQQNLHCYSYFVLYQGKIVY